MLVPNRHTDPDLTVLNIASYMIMRLRRTNVKSFEELRTIVHEKDHRADALFLPSLQFLYLLNLIEYHPNNDKIEYLGSNEA
jgi:hypothetical protein